MFLRRFDLSESKGPSEWQQRISGEWFGLPSVFDADGSHTGFNKVNRSSVYEDGQTTYYMHCDFMNTGRLRNRFEIKDFAFAVRDDDKNRVYLGPDFYGAGHPYGALVDSHYYSPAWRADLNTVNHILADGVTQVYSSLLYEGPSLFAVFNGVYRLATDYESNPETQAEIEAFLSKERELAAWPHTLPDRRSGAWIGECEVFGADQEKRGSVAVELRHSPEDLVRSSQTWTFEGEFNRSFSYSRTRIGNRHTYDGPDLYGNAIAYGRALYTTQHHCSEAFKVSGREFILSRDYSMAVVWKLYEGDVMSRVLFGSLVWHPDEGA